VRERERERERERKRERERERESCEESDNLLMVSLSLKDRRR